MQDASEAPRRRRFARRKREPTAAMSVMEHLSELRDRLIKSVIALAVISVAAFALYDRIMGFLLQPLCTVPADLLSEGCTLKTFSAMEGFNVRLKVTALTAILFASPVWLYQLWAFIMPGLTHKEKRYAFPFVASSILLFLIGTTFAYLLMPGALGFLIRIAGEDVEVLFRAQEYINFVGLMFIAFGLSFELPLVLFFLGLAGVVSVDQLRHHRRIAAVGSAALSAVVTPTQDPYSMLAMWIPLYLLYELTIVLLRLVRRRKAKQAAS